ncbi:MAG: hypothetical protein HY821_03610, partial [Acidobacteria bacterium]|nr:hypothetical protein [Acidobacteriota bacterium]
MRTSLGVEFRHRAHVLLVPALLCVMGDIGSLRAQSPTDAWYLMETKSDPGKRSRQEPQIYEGKNLGGYDRYTLQTGYFRYEVVRYGLQRELQNQWASELFFNAPPAVIQRGTTFDLTIRGKNTVTKAALHGGASGRWGGPEGLEDQMRLCRIPLAYDNPSTFAAECSTSVRFTAGNLPDEFSFIQVAQGQGVTGEFRYCKNRVCPSGNPAQAPAEEESTLQAAVTCDPNPLALRISELPSRDCTVWISGWRRNTAEVVQVIAPDAVDNSGNHRNGIQLFGVTPAGMANVGVAPANMSGFRSPDGSYGKVYPWLVRVFACPGQSGTGASCYGYRAVPGPFQVRLTVRQKGARDANVTIDGTANLRAGQRPEDAVGGQGQGGPAGGGAAGGGGAGNAMQGQIYCSTRPLQLRISGLPSQTCTIWISGWRRNTADPVQVLLPEARDGYGNHANGVQVFGAVRPGEPAMGVAPATMSGYRAPDGSYGTSYPWNLQLFACPGQQGAGVNCFQYRAAPGPFNVPVILRQRGAPDTNLVLSGTTFAGRDDPFGASNTPPWTPPQAAPAAQGGAGGGAPAGGAGGWGGAVQPPPQVPQAPPVAVAVPGAAAGQPVAAAPAAAAAGPKPAAVSVTSAAGTGIFGDSVWADGLEIRLSPGDPRADIAGRCNMITATILAVAKDSEWAITAGGGWNGPGSLVDLLLIVRAVCRERLGLPPGVGMRRTATARLPEGSPGGADGDSGMAADVTIDLPAGPVRFEVPHPETTLTVRTAAGSVRSTGVAKFRAAFDPKTQTLAAVAE